MSDDPARDDGLLDLIRQGRNGVLVTLRRDGRPQLSNITYAFDEAERLIRVSVTDTRAKTRNLRRDPRAALHVTTPDAWSYAVVDSTAQLTPVAEDPHDDTVEELIRLYKAVLGEHPDWDEYRTAMVADQRLVIRLPIERVYGWRRPEG